MKKSILITKSLLLAGLVLFSVTSCNENLDLTPQANASQGDLPAGGFEQATFGIYGKLRDNGLADWTRFWFQNIRSDDATKGSTTGDAASIGQEFDTFNYSKTSGITKDNWVGHYGLIIACNALLSDIEASGDTGSGTVTNKAEARAVRAWAYFELRRDYGEIPLFTKKSTTVSDAFIAKSTVAQVDAFIETELKEAAAALPLSWPSAYVGRATKGFANALLAKLYLYQGKYADAYTKSTEVINSGQYSLLSDFKKVFSKEGNNSSESVFEIQFLCRDISDVDKYNSMYYGQQGFRGSGSWDLGWGFNAPTQNLINSFASNDPRKDATILVSGQNDGYGLTVPSVNDTSGLWNKKAYTDPADRKTIGVLYNRWFNIKIIRYADVLLMAAEAAIQTGNTAVAANYFNQVRNRVGLSSIAAPSLSDLKSERRAELAMENERFYDLVRWGDAASVLGSLGYTAKNSYYPIPQDAIDQSGGKLVQNSNY